MPAIALAAIAFAGCGAKSRADRPVAKATAPPPALRVGVVGRLQVSVPRVGVTRGRLASVQRYPLVLVSSGAATAQAVADAAAANPGSHFALVGASAKKAKRPNLVGVVFREPQAAMLGGMLAGYVAAAQNVSDPIVAWVGPAGPGLVRSFGRGVHRVDGGASLLVAHSSRVPSDCKESALSALQRGAVFVMAWHGLCAAAVADAASEQNQVAASVRDFELPNAAVDAIVREALGGQYSGGEDVIFGLATGAIGVGRLDPHVPAAVAVKVRGAAQALAVRASTIN